MGQRASRRRSSDDCAARLGPIIARIRARLFAGERIHADDTTVPILAEGKTATDRPWTYVRDDRPLGGADPLAAVFCASCDRTGAHPERHLVGFSSIMQAEAYAGFNGLYAPSPKPGPIVEAGCAAHGRRELFERQRNGPCAASRSVANRTRRVTEKDAIVATLAQCRG